MLVRGFRQSTANWQVSGAAVSAVIWICSLQPSPLAAAEPVGSPTVTPSLVSESTMSVAALPRPEVVKDSGPRLCPEQETRPHAVESRLGQR